MKAATTVVSEGTGRTSATGGMVCSAGAACVTTVGAFRAGTMGGTESLCAPPARTDTIKPRGDTDSSDTVDVLKDALRAKLCTTAALDMARGKDTKGRTLETCHVGSGEEVRDEEERPGARVNTAVFLAVTPIVTLLREPVWW